MRTEYGAITVDGRQVASTCQCCHCGAHFVFRRGSGTDRGFCMKCGRLTCGKPACDPCNPIEKQRISNAR